MYKKYTKYMKYKGTKYFSITLLEAQNFESHTSINKIGIVKGRSEVNYKVIIEENIIRKT